MKREDIQTLYEYLERLERNETLSMDEAIEFSDLVEVAREEVVFSDPVLRSLTEVSVQALFDAERQDRTPTRRGHVRTSPPSRVQS